MDLQQLTIIGRVGQDPTLKDTGTVKIIKISVATSYKEKTTWVRVTCFQKLAELANQLISKGDLVFAEGRFAIEEYQKDGETKFSVELIADKILLLNKKGPKAEAPAPVEQYPF